DVIEPVDQPTYANSIAIAPDGDVFYGFDYANRIRKVQHGIRSDLIVAGDGMPGFSGDGGPAVEASLNGPQGLAHGPDGSLYIADTYNHRIRRVSPDGIIDTVVGAGPTGVNEGGFS